jgi:hypothetical protein
MKFSMLTGMFCTVSIATVLISSAANAAEYKLEPSGDSYLSLNECLYAVSKGTPIGAAVDGIYIYKNELWQFTYATAEQTVTCDQLGVLSE